MYLASIKTTAFRSSVHYNRAVVCSAEELEIIEVGDVHVKGAEEDVWLWRCLYLKTNYCVRKV
jgi:hypothetical protein